MIRIGDYVKILDGSDIEDYEGGWAGSMEDYVGQVKRVEWLDATSCLLEDIDYVWDLRGVKKLCKTTKFSQREINRIKYWVEWATDDTDDCELYVDDPTMVELIIDALTWFAEHYGEE